MSIRLLLLDLEVEVIFWLATFAVLIISGGCGVVELERQLVDERRNSSLAEILVDRPIAYFANEPLASDGNSVDAEVTGLNVDSYRYAVVVTRILQRRDLASAILGQPKFIARLSKKSSKIIFDRIVADPVARGQLKRVALRIIGNQNLVAAITNGDGVDSQFVTSKMAGIIADANKLDQEQDQAKRKELQDKISKTLQDLQKNKALVAATLKGMALQGEFLSQLLRQENIIEDILGDPELIAEVLKLEEGQLFNKIVDIPVAVEKLQEVTFAVLENESLLEKLLVPSATEDAKALLSAFLGLLKKLEASEADEDVGDIKEQIAEIFQGLSENQQLIAHVFSSLVLEAAFLAHYPDFCEEGADYSEELDLSERIYLEGLREDLGREGLRAICVVGEDDDGNEQEEPTVEVLEGQMRVSLSGDNLPEEGALTNRRRLEVTVQGHSPSLVGYRYLLVDGNDCPFDTSRYSQQVYSFEQTISTLTVASGVRGLCVFGVDSDHQLATNIVSRSWRYQVPKGPPRFDVWGTIQHFFAGEETVNDVVIRNIGEGTLNWQLSVSRPIEWLDIRLADDGNWLDLGSVASSEVQTTVVNGATESGGASNLQLRVSSIPSETNGIEQEVLTLRREGSPVPITITVTLHVPKMRLTAEEVVLTGKNPQYFIGVRNDNPEASLHWKVRHVFPVEIVGTHVSSTRHLGIDRRGWNTGAGGAHLDVRRPLPTKNWIQVLIFEYRGGKPIPVAVFFEP